MLFCQDDDASSLRSFIGQRGELRRIRKLLFLYSRHRHKFGCLAVPQGNGAGLVEEQDVHIPGGFDGLSGHGDDVCLNHPVHAGDSDGGEEAADRGGNETDQQGDNYCQAEGRPLSGCPDAVKGKGNEGCSGQQKNERKTGKEDVEGDLVRRFLASGPFHHGDHLVEECFSRVGGDADDQPVRQHPGAAGYGASVAAAFPDHRGALPGDGAFIDRGDTDRHLAVAGDDFPGFHQDDIALFQSRTGDDIDQGIPAWFLKTLGCHVPPGAFQRSCLGLPPSFRHGFREVGEKQGEPQPETYGHNERDRFLAAPGKGLKVKQGGQDAADFHDKHHRVLDQVQRIQLAEGVNEGRPDYPRVGKGE